MNTLEIGDPIDRVEARLKVTGTAKYAYEYPLENMAYGVLVTSTIAKGTVSGINGEEIRKLPGVIEVLSHLNRPAVPGYDKPVDQNKTRYYGQEFRLFYNDHVAHANQPVAMVIAETFEQARYAAMRVKVKYQEEQHHTDLKTNLSKATIPHRPSDSLRGRPEAWTNAPVVVDQEYHTAIQVHNSMEPHATTAWWQPSGKLMIYNKTQFVQSTKSSFINYFDLEEKDIEVHSPFVGGAFGSASRVWPHEMAAVLGAKKVRRPVKVALDRTQVFNMIGYRPYAIQNFKIGAEPDGKITGIHHIASGMTSSYEEFVERVTDPTKSMYACDNLQTTYKLVPLDVSTPTHTRGPGETTGSFALESAVDELAYALNMDPVELRIKNFAAKDPDNNLPWTSNHLLECYRKGVDLFGWNKRNPKPATMKSGELLLGMGMSAGIYKATRDEATASATLKENGTFLVQTSVADTGPGSATVFTQVAAETLDTDLSNVHFLWGNSTLPPAPGQFGSHTTTSVGSAVYDACVALKEKILDFRINGKPGGRDLSYPELLKLNGLTALSVTKESKAGEEKKKYSGKSFCANFVEVLVDPLTGTVKVNRVVSVVDCGKVINKKTAESQVVGSVVWGIGIALMEEGVIDHRMGKYVNNNLADYHVPVSADIPDIQVAFIDKEDNTLDPIGAKGLGEIPLIGFTAAVANAIYHATGKRIRKLPITPDKLL